MGAFFSTFSTFWTSQPTSHFDLNRSWELRRELPRSPAARISLQTKLTQQDLGREGGERRKGQIPSIEWWERRPTCWGSAKELPGCKEFEAVETDILNQKRYRGNTRRSANINQQLLKVIVFTIVLQIDYLRLHRNPHGQLSFLIDLFSVTNILPCKSVCD